MGSAFWRIEIFPGLPDGASAQPVLACDLHVEDLAVAGNASLSLKGHDLTVTGDATVDGRLSADGKSAISFAGDVAIATLDAPATEIVLDGTRRQTVALPPEAIDSLRIANATEVAFSRSFVARSLRCGEDGLPHLLSFSPGTKATVYDLVLAGGSDNGSIRLQSLTAGTHWELSVIDHAISGVTVSDCDASSGQTIYPAASTDGGHNVNWAFDDTRKRWTGALDNDFGKGENWADGLPPLPGDDLLITGKIPALLSAVREIGSLAIAPGASLTITTNVVVRGSVTIERNGLLTWDKPATIGGDLVLKTGALLTHSPNGKTEANKIDLAVAGDGYLAPGARIDAKGKGYQVKSGPGYKSQMATHGGRGARGTIAAPCYGSIVSPTNCGSSGEWNVTIGGGAIAIAFGGHLRNLGSIAANGNDEKSNPSYYGAGGSVLLTAASTSGDGEITANGGDRIEGGGALGGGGRVAVKLKGPGADFRAFHGRIEAYGSRHDLMMQGSSGTIYTETSAQQNGRGQVLVDGTSFTSIAAYQRFTDFPSTSLCEKDEVKRTTVVLKGLSRLNLTEDTEIDDIILIGKEPILHLNGHTLTVRHKKHPLGVDEAKQVTLDPATGGEIIWLPRRVSTRMIIR